MQSTADVITVICMIVIPILAWFTGIWFAGYVTLKAKAKAKNMTYS